MLESMFISLWAIVAFVAVIGVTYVVFVPSYNATLGDLHDVQLNPVLDKMDSNGNRILVYHKDFFGEGTSGIIEGVHGRIHYFMVGPLNGTRLVIIHGIGSCWSSMAPFITTLAQTHNLRILGFDLYGRGYSASPGVPYSTSLYVSQLKELLDGVGWMSSSVSSSDNEMTAKVNVLGFSMGGGIAVAFVEKYGKWVEKVVLMAPSGLIEKEVLGAHLLKTPIIGKLVAHTVGRYILANGAAKEFPKGWENDSNWVQYMDIVKLMTTRHPGYIRAFVSSVRHGPTVHMKSSFSVVGEMLGERVLCLWGTSDSTCSFGECVPVFKNCMPRAKFIEIEGVGHELPMAGEHVCALVNQFLTSS